MRTITKMPSTEIARYRSAGPPLMAPRVDRTRNVLHGVAIIQLGDLNHEDPREQFIDETSLQHVLELGQQQANGVKARFTHPTISSDGLGKMIGRHKSFRMSANGTAVLADLHMSESGRTAPEGDLVEYVMNLAEEDPESFGISIAGRADRKAEEKLVRKSDGKKPLRLKALLAADVVDEPAATRGGVFGGSELSLATAPHQATAALNTLFADATPDVIRSRVGAFIENYINYRFGGDDHADLSSGLLAEPFNDVGGAVKSASSAVHLDAITSYLEDHYGYAVDGRTLLDHVEFWVDNTPGAVKPTAETWAAIERQSRELQAKFENGEVVDKYAIKAPSRFGL